MTKYKSTYKLYNCNEAEFNKRLNVLRKMIEIFNDDNNSEQDKAYKLFDLCNKVSTFEQKYELLLWNGSDDPRLKGVREYINILLIKLNEYKELGYEKSAAQARVLGIEKCKKAILVVNSYLECQFYTEENILKELGITDFEFEEHIRKVRIVDYELYMKYLNKKAMNPRKLYKCGEEEFNKKIELLINMIKIYDNEEYSEIDRAYQMFKLCNKASEFDQKFKTLLLKGKDDPRLNGIYDYISEISKMLNKYKNLGCEQDFAQIRKLERKIEGRYEQARMAIFNYIESKYFIEEQILEDIGVASYEFEKHVEFVKLVAPKLYLQYQDKCMKNVILRYDDAINSFVEIADAIENGHFSDKTKFSLLEFWARVPFKENYKNYDLEFKKINPNFPKFGFDFINRVKPFIAVVLPKKQQDIILNFMRENSIKAVSNTMTNAEAKFKYSGLKNIVKRYTNENDEEVLISFDFTEEDFQNIIDYIKLRRMPLVYEVFDCVLSEYVKGNITKDTIKQMKSNNVKEKKC